METKTLDPRAIFAVVYSAVTGSVYFALGVIADHALGYTPLVFLTAGLFAALAVMTYAEGTSLYPEPGGSTVLARYAFNELVSFVAGWAILLDYVILIAITTLAAVNYMSVFWPWIGQQPQELVATALVIGGVVALNIRGLTAARHRRIVRIAVVDLALQTVIIVVGLALVFSPDVLTDPFTLGRPLLSTDVLYALALAVVVISGLESASGLAGEIEIDSRAMLRLTTVGIGFTFLIYIGIALITAAELPIDPQSALEERSFIEAPIVYLVEELGSGGAGIDLLRYAVAVMGTVVLITAASTAMLGLSRLGYALAVNRQIPRGIGRLHSRRGTPFVLIGLAGAVALALVVPNKVDFLLGSYAFGATLALTIAHVSVCRMRYRDPQRRRPYRIPFSVSVAGGKLPLPAVLGAIASLGAWVSVVALHPSARYIGIAWLVGGLLLYGGYRKNQGKSLFRRVKVPDTALREEPKKKVEYGSVLVPVFGDVIDDDIVQTAGRLVAEHIVDEAEDELSAAQIEALWVFEIPMSLPVDAALPDERIEQARKALARAKAIGEEYGGVRVETCMRRGRRAGKVIVDEARRRGVEAIVLAAEEPSKIRGGALLGGHASGRDNFVGEVTKYVINKAPCRVILTAPPVNDRQEGP